MNVSHREANDGRVRRHRYHPVERVGLERLGTGRGGSVRRAGDRGASSLTGLLSSQVIIVITLYGHGDGSVDDHGTPRRREDDVSFDVDVVSRGGHAVDAMALGCDRRGRAQADEHE